MTSTPITLGLRDATGESDANFTFNNSETRLLCQRRTNLTVLCGGEEMDVGWVDNFYMPKWLQVLLGMLYATVSLTAIIGNLCVFYIILKNRSRRRFIVDYFIFNLAISDILVAALCVNLTYYSMLYMNWPFGEFMCKTVSFLQISSVSASIFTLVAVSLDRYVHIINPLRPRMTRAEARWVIAVIWVLSIVSATPSAIHSTTSVIDDRKMCGEIWDPPINSYYYSIAIMILLYFFPVLILMITYIMIGIYILKWKMPGEKLQDRDKKQTKAKRKMVKMFAVIVFIFAVCYLPIHIFTLIADKYPELYDTRYFKMVYFTVHFTAMTHCTANPLVYASMNSRFRDGFKYIFKTLMCRRGTRSFGGSRTRPFGRQTPAYSSSNTQSESLQISRTSSNKLGKIRKKAKQAKQTNTV